MFDGMNRCTKVQTDVSRHVHRHVCGHVHGHIAKLASIPKLRVNMQNDIDACLEMCVGVFIGTCTDMCVGKCK